MRENTHFVESSSPGFVVKGKVVECDPSMKNTTVQLRCRGMPIDGMHSADAPYSDILDLLEVNLCGRCLSVESHVVDAVYVQGATHSLINECDNQVKAGICFFLRSMI